MTPPVMLTIAGSDSGGGAGIQADLKTCAAHGVFGTSAITAVTAQNTQAVSGFVALAADFVDQQVAAVLADLPVAAVKTGMLASPEIVAAVTARAASGELPNLVVDPVLVAGNGDPLALGGAAAMYPELFSYATVITPNLREASLLVGRDITTVDQMRGAAEQLAETGARCVVVKGGHLPSTARAAVDMVWRDGEVSYLREPWIDTGNTHGTGCTFASSVAAGLACGDSLPDALGRAKEYVTAVLAAAVDWRLGKGGNGPLNHFRWRTR
jgi:hydroxymethylpyrimidine/phosphomethylpyrimidine kinase